MIDRPWPAAITLLPTPVALRERARTLLADQGVLPPGSSLAGLLPAGTRPGQGWPTGDDLVGMALSDDGWLIAVDSQVVGGVGIKGAVTGSADAPGGQGGTAEIGYGMAPAWHGRGIGTEAVRQLVEELATRGDIGTVTAQVAETNTASLRLLARLGFVPHDGPVAAGHVWRQLPHNS